MKYATAIMQQYIRRTAMRLLVLSIAATAAYGQARTPEVPCPEIAVESGNVVAFHAYATGVQIYWWNGSKWGFVAPMAKLYANSDYTGLIGVHYGGPTWKSKSGGLVIGKRINGCQPDTNSIAWLLLGVDEVDGQGLFSDTTFIQRLNTVGGNPPSQPGTYDGEEVQIPYTAEYYFYRRATPLGAAE